MKNLNYYLNINNVENILSKDIYKELFLLVKKEEVKTIFRKLANFWHPDKNNHKKAGEIFVLINSAYEKFKKIENNTILNKLIIDTDLPKYEINYFKKEKTNFGYIYIGKSFICYEFEKQFNDIYKNGVENLKLPYLNKNIEEQMDKFILKAKISSNNFLLFNKEKDLILLSDLINIKGNIDIKHVAWIINTMFNNACYFYSHNLVYCSFETQNYLINTKMHSGYINFPFFIHKKEEKLKFLSKTAIENINSNILKNKIANNSIDVDMIKMSARTMLGDITGATFYKRNDIPKEFRLWLLSYSSDNVIQEYKIYSNLLEKCFGPRKFIDMNISFEDIYI